jgi:hypothetical protein
VVTYNSSQDDFPNINEPKRVHSLSKTPKIKSFAKKLDMSGIEPLPALNEKDKLFHDNLALRGEIKKLKLEITYYKAEANRSAMDLDKREKQFQDFLEKEKSDVSFNVNVMNSPDVSAKLREVRGIFNL